MRSVIKLFFLGAFFIISGSALAQIGYVNYMELVNAIPEKATADKQLEAYAQSLDKQRQQMEQEYSQKLTQLQSQADTLSEAIINIRAQELKDLENRIASFGQAAQQDIANKRDELYQPIIDKVDNAIKAVAEEKGIKYVLEKNNLLYSVEAGNLTDEVKAKLDL